MVVEVECERMTFEGEADEKFGIDVRHQLNVSIIHGHNLTK